MPAYETLLKDMAGIGRPAMLGKIVAAIKSQHPDIVKQMKDIIKAEHTESSLFKVTLPK